MHVRSSSLRKHADELLKSFDSDTCATYLDLGGGEFTATGEMQVRPGQNVVPKDGVHYETWNRLIGEEKS